MSDFFASLRRLRQPRFCPGGGPAHDRGSAARMRQQRPANCEQLFHCGSVEWAMCQEPARLGRTPMPRNRLCPHRAGGNR